MGAAHSRACITCRKDYYLGYGPYSSLPERQKRFPDSEHNGHELIDYTEDYTSMEGDDLMMDGYRESELLVKDLGKFEKINLSGEE